MTTFEKIIKIRDARGAGYFVLIDPDKWEAAEIAEMANNACEGGADAILVGGSLLMSSSFDELVQAIKRQIDIPLIIFPGGITQVSRYADAIFFMSLLSGRNPTYLIGEQVRAAPAIKTLGLEPISVAYMLIESGKTTSGEFMSNTRPIPRDKPDIAMATALAAEYFGMQFIYLEGGSGAENPVPSEMILAVRNYVSIPLIVGGGIKTPEEAAGKVSAGASFVVTGNVLEKDGGVHMVKEFAEAIHRRN